jgi:hypothetical protein
MWQGLGLGYSGAHVFFKNKKNEYRSHKHHTDHPFTHPGGHATPQQLVGLILSVPTSRRADDLLAEAMTMSHQYHCTAVSTMGHCLFVDGD